MTECLCWLYGNLKVINIGYWMLLDQNKLWDIMNSSSCDVEWKWAIYSRTEKDISFDIEWAMTIVFEFLMFRKKLFNKESSAVQCWDTTNGGVMLDPRKRYPQKCSKA